MIRIFTDYYDVGKAILANEQAVRKGLESLIRGKNNFEIAGLVFKMQFSVGAFEVYRKTDTQNKVATIWIQAN